jgi:syntaxin 5
MRKRFNSESENSITQVVIDQEEDNNLYKDKAIQEQSFTTKISSTFKSFYNYPQLPSNSILKPSNSSNINFELDNSQEAPDSEEVFVMTSRDRTAEFSNTIRSLHGRNINRVVNLRDPKRVKQMQSYSEFMNIAKNIGRNIASTYTKLEKLTLCK